MPNFTVSGGLTTSNSLQLNNLQFKQNFTATAESEIWTGKITLCNDSDNFDYSLQAAYFPLCTSTCDLGLSTIYHSEIKPKKYTDFDTLLGPQISCQFSDTFFYEASVYFFLKYTHFNSKTLQISNIFTKTLALNMDFYFMPSEDFSLGFKISSFNDYKYNCFFTPFWTFYTTLQLTNQLDFHVELEAAYVDMFTLSANLSQISFSSYLQWSF